MDEVDRKLSSMHFPAKLMHIIDHEDDNIVRWAENGACFVIMNQKRFEMETLPRYFHHGKFASFQRQLNLYGFRRISRGPSEGFYFHPSFHCGRADLLQGVKRLPRKTSKHYAEMVQQRNDLLQKQRNISEQVRLTQSTDALHQHVGEPGERPSFESSVDSVESGTFPERAFPMSHLSQGQPFKKGQEDGVAASNFRGLEALDSQTSSQYVALMANAKLAGQIPYGQSGFGGRAAPYFNASQHAQHAQHLPQAPQMRQAATLNKGFGVRGIKQESPKNLDHDGRLTAEQLQLMRSNTSTSSDGRRSRGISGISDDLMAELSESYGFSVTQSHLPPNMREAVKEDGGHIRGDSLNDVILSPEELQEAMPSLSRQTSEEAMDMSGVPNRGERTSAKFIRDELTALRRIPGRGDSIGSNGIDALINLAELAEDPNMQASIYDSNPGQRKIAMDEEGECMDEVKPPYLGAFAQSSGSKAHSRGSSGLSGMFGSFGSDYSFGASFSSGKFNDQLPSDYTQLQQAMAEEAQVRGQAVTGFRFGSTAGKTGPNGQAVLR